MAEKELPHKQLDAQVRGTLENPADSAVRRAPTPCPPARLFWAGFSPDRENQQDMIQNLFGHSRLLIKDTSE